MSHPLRAACLASALALLASASAPTALADHSAPLADATHAAVDVSGAIFHDPLGMCHWSGCPWPWNVPGNFVGTCEDAAGEGGWLRTCDGVWRELYFDVQVAGGGFGLTRLGAPVDAVGLRDSLALHESRGIVAVFCSLPPDPTTTECVTNVSTFSLVAKIWRGTA